MTATFYDSRLRTVLSHEDRYRSLYQAALALIPRRSASVVELGSGSGAFARLLLSKRKVAYLGIDFAANTVALAQMRVGLPYFKVDDLRTCEIPPADTYVSLETLEHLDDDLGLLSRLPSQSRVVLSVPSFPSASHVRWFPDHGDASERYGEVLKVDHEQYVSLPNGAYFHLLRGTTV